MTTVISESTDVVSSTSTDIIVSTDTTETFYSVAATYTFTSVETTTTTTSVTQTTTTTTVTISTVYDLVYGPLPTECFLGDTASNDWYATSQIGSIGFYDGTNEDSAVIQCVGYCDMYSMSLFFQ
jgi:hypothetical protein